VSHMVTPKTCAKCHPAEHKQFASSGHYRAWIQVEKKKGLQDLMYVHEGQNNPKFKGAPKETGCMQCHGSRIKMDDKRRATADTWPNSGMGTIWPDESVGNCTVCHTRHSFSISEARKPEACASCHLGPDHPDIEIFLNSKHGHVYETNKMSYKWDSPPDAWEPGDYKAPLCATCHMSGIGKLTTTHNVSRRLHWNLWAKRSNPRNSKDPLNAMTGDAVAGRAEMKQVCGNCHMSNFADNFFKQGDKQVNLYNEAYYDKALVMLNDLKKKNLLAKNPWKDKFQKVYYHLWHHEGRRMRQGAMMGAPDWAHWHGVFEVMQAYYELEEIYKKRIETNKIEEL